MPTYTYDPSRITEGGISQMRFELGDTMIEQGPMTCPLCDEEYTAIIKKYGSNWRRARYMCLKAIVMKLSYEVVLQVHVNFPPVFSFSVSTLPVSAPAVAPP